jgi:hypothetical protein
MTTPSVEVADAQSNLNHLREILRDDVATITVINECLSTVAQNGEIVDNLLPDARQTLMGWYRSQNLDLEGISDEDLLAAIVEDKRAEIDLRKGKIATLLLTQYYVEIKLGKSTKGYDKIFNERSFSFMNKADQSYLTPFLSALKVHIETLVQSHDETSRSLAEAIIRRFFDDHHLTEVDVNFFLNLAKEKSKSI